MSQIKFLKLALAAVASSVLVSCGVVSEDPESQEENVGEKIDQNQAYEKVEEHINGAVAMLPDGVTLEPLSDPTFSTCDESSDGGEQGHVSVGHIYWLRDLPTEDNESAAETLHQYWSVNGYEILEDRRPEEISMWVEHNEDAFRMSLRVSNQGTLSLGASSPCVRSDDGT